MRASRTASAVAYRAPPRPRRARTRRTGGRGPSDRRERRVHGAGGHVEAGDQLARPQRRLDLRRVAGRDVQRRRTACVRVPPGPMICDLGVERDQAPARSRPDRSRCSASLAPSTACLRLTPSSAAQPAAGVALVAGSLATSRKYVQRVRCSTLPPSVAMLRSCGAGGELQRLRDDGIVALDRGMVGRHPPCAPARRAAGRSADARFRRDRACKRVDVDHRRGRITSSFIRSIKRRAAGEILRRLAAPALAAQPRAGCGRGCAR